MALSTGRWVLIKLSYIIHIFSAMHSNLISNIMINLIPLDFHN